MQFDPIYLELGQEERVDQERKEICSMKIWMKRMMMMKKKRRKPPLHRLPQPLNLEEEYKNRIIHSLPLRREEWI